MQTVVRTSKTNTNVRFSSMCSKSLTAATVLFSSTWSKSCKNIEKILLKGYGHKKRDCAQSQSLLTLNLIL